MHPKGSIVTYYLAPSLVKLRSQINKRWPNRDKASDGWIGDTSHSARKSDHNPDYADGGVVRALDIDKDGIDVGEVLDVTVGADWVAYIIWNRRIWTHAEGWEKYSGTNGHTAHVHVSIRHTNAAESATPRAFNGNVNPVASTPAKTPAKGATVKQNSGNSKQDNIAIAELLNALGYEAGRPDGVPGTYLRDGVKSYQKAQTYFPGMNEDGDWGAMTQAHYEWVRDELQRNVAMWSASKRLGKLRQDGDHADLTKKHITAVMKDNMHKGGAYYKAGGRIADGVPGPVFCKMLGIPNHPSA